MEGVGKEQTEGGTEETGGRSDGRRDEHSVCMCSVGVHLVRLKTWRLAGIVGGELLIVPVDLALEGVAVLEARTHARAPRGR